MVLTSTTVLITFIDASCVEPSHLATMLVNLYLKKRFSHKYTSQKILIYNFLIFMTQKLLRIHTSILRWNVLSLKNVLPLKKCCCNLKCKTLNITMYIALWSTKAWTFIAWNPFRQTYMNSFNKTEAAVFSFRPCFLRASFSSV